MVDIHSHILPGMDDGAKTTEEAVEMAKIAWNDGITDIIATPHTHDGIFLQSSEKVLEAVQNLQAALEREGLPIRVHPGAEVHVHAQIVDNVWAGHILSLGNGMKYLLLEFPAVHFPLFAADIVKNLLASGITPVIAHPERIDVFRRQPSLLEEWISIGAICQVTAGSLVGSFGPVAREVAFYLVKRRLAHLIASDSHHVKTRRPELSYAYKILSASISGEELEVFHHNAQAVLHREALRILPPPAKSRQKRWFFF